MGCCEQVDGVVAGATQNLHAMAGGDADVHVSRLREQRSRRGAREQASTYRRNLNIRSAPNRHNECPSERRLCSYKAALFRDR